MLPLYSPSYSLPTITTDKLNSLTNDLQHCRTEAAKTLSPNELQSLLTRAVVTARKWGVPDNIITTFITNHTDVHRVIALFAAVERNDRNTVGFLIEIGTNVNAQGYGVWSTWWGTPLHSAAWCSVDQSIIQMLLNAGANKNIKDVYGNRPYSQAWNGMRWGILA